MSLPVVTGAAIQCSFGAAPATLGVLPTKLVNMEGKPVATIEDAKPLINIPTFGMCMTLSNPTVAAATAAAAGVLTPMPCIPVTTAWLPGSPTILVGGIPVVNDKSKCACAYGGVISVLFGGAMTESIP